MKGLISTVLTMDSQLRQNYSHECEASVNRLINLEMYAAYVYISMSYYFDRDDVALENFSKFFKSQSHEEQEHAEKLMKYQNQRGGRIVFQDIKKPERDEWSSGLEAMNSALELEKNINQSVLDLHKMASDKSDPHLCDFLDSHCLGEKVETIKKLGDYITNLRRVDAAQNGMGEYLFDKHTLGDS
ncbi:ferritin heavy chain B-like [Protopterus annectens]|uniref:ferritin heavy chain B-like n=1 Tax=Protopterus annectens TaxID=7888 RepID=UPI001CF9CDAD|nr:ferritin heavy chain B-like [Protopterus annectens]